MKKIFELNVQRPLIGQLFSIQLSDWLKLKTLTLEYFDTVHCKLCDISFGIHIFVWECPELMIHHVVTIYLNQKYLWKKH